MAVKGQFEYLPPGHGAERRRTMPLLAAISVIREAAGDSDSVIREAAGGSDSVIRDAARDSDSVIVEAAGGSDIVMSRVLFPINSHEDRTS